MTRQFVSAEMRLRCFRVLNYVLSTQVAHGITDRQVYSAIGMSRGHSPRSRTSLLRMLLIKKGHNTPPRPRGTHLSGGGNVASD